jgi:ribosomal protein L11 methylase PrmA
LGCKSVFANDIDDWAAENISENATYNNITNIIFEKGGLEILKDEKFEIILANINKNVLMTSFKKLAEHAQTGTKLHPPLHVIVGIGLTVNHDRDRLLLYGEKGTGYS